MVWCTWCGLIRVAGHSDESMGQVHGCCLTCICCTIWRSKSLHNLACYSHHSLTFPVVQSCSETLTILPEERVRVINSTVNIQQRILRLYDLIENDL